MRRKFKNTWASIIRRHSGFTLIELTVAIIVLSILIAIAFSVYSNYVNKAKIAIAESALDNARDNLEAYYSDNSKYPNSIDFIDCLDENGRVVFPPSFCNQLRKDLSSIEGYSSDTSKTFELKARATDTQKTLITVTPNKITTQGN